MCSYPDEGDLVIQSGGALIKSPTTIWSGSTAEWGYGASSSLDLFRWSSYAEIYRKQLWVSVLVNKLARAQARLPLKVYERTDVGRLDASTHPYAELLRNPLPGVSSVTFWRWVCSTRLIFGEAILYKQRDSGGRPIRLLPLHPTKIAVEMRDGETFYEFRGTDQTVSNIPAKDVVHFREYDPDTSLRGMSPLEPLRSTLENEDAARRATSSFWRNGARPGTALSHPKSLSKEAAERLKANWDAISAGADNTGKTVVLEEGMKPERLSLTAEEAQYIDTRKLNREEVCAAYDVPPPVVHILDRATFSNITEQMRSMYRDTMAPRLKEDEAELDTQLRQTDFGDEVYAEFLLDEVLRGDFEARMDSYQKAINSAILTPGEVRTKENYPPLDGADQLYINAALVPLNHARQDSTDSNDSTAVRSFMGRLGRCESVDDVEACDRSELNGKGAIVVEQIRKARADNCDITELRRRLASALEE